MNWFITKVGKYHPSTYMIFASLVATGIASHPTAITYVMMALNAPLLFVTREVARIEGKTTSVCKKCVAFSLVAAGGALFMMLSMKWFAV